MRFVEAPTNFYLGARVDPETGQVIPDDVVYYDSRDLTTHGVILGMTGSGKTGLGVVILEEAVIDNIPVLVIDPKGDITNMLLAFPDLTPEYFKPWVNPEDALRADQALDDYARTVAEMWREGLAQWGITNERIQTYRYGARFSIYTPGSTAGLPISILRSFAAPREGWQGNEEILRERISGIVTAILGLIGIDARPVEDPEHILLSNILEYNWRNGVDLSLEQLILQVQKPPFSKLGVMDVETILPEKERFKLARSLNNIIAAPNFQNWIQGEPIDIPSFLYTPEGTPRCSIFYLAHLNDAERQFIITLLLEELISWMRSLSGSTSLRALVYIDEVFGMIPPYPRNPPTKEPIMRLLKQARAFGVGMLISTQNPKDLDYKGLSNIGTWFIGKLQTENDKERVLEGLDTARDATSALNIGMVDDLITNLRPRQFILHNVHEEETPILMQTRWAMSYLRGPLTRDQISKLMANQRGVYQQPQAYPSYLPPASGGGVAPAGGGGVPSGGQAEPALVDYPPPGAGRAGTVPPTYSGGAPDTGPLSPAVPASAPTGRDESDIPPGFSPIPPVLPSSVHQYYLPTEYTVEQAIRQWENWTRQPAINVETHRRLLYRPSLLAQVHVRYSHRASGTTHAETYAFVVPSLPRVPYLNWGEYRSEPFDPYSLEPNPFADAFYAEVPPELSRSTGFKELRANLVDWIYQNTWVTIYYNPVLKVYSQLGESKRDFQIKIQSIARQKRDEEVDRVAARYDKRLAQLEARAQKKAMRLSAEQEELQARKMEEMISAGETLMHMLRGRSYYALSRTSRLRRYTNTSQDQVELLERDLLDITRQLDETEREMEEALQAVQQKWAEVVRQIEEVRVTPYKKDINIVLFGIGWVPYWDVRINGTPVILPASSSSLSVAQDPNIDDSYYGSAGGYGYDGGGYDTGYDQGW
ncbi:MAG TPA: DUF87 domain-containing protein [Chloroflexi bacterium]|nr:DUF87 domain-containing protein [Chloroflexota bacterium]